MYLYNMGWLAIRLVRAAWGLAWARLGRGVHVLGFARTASHDEEVVWAKGASLGVSAELDGKSSFEAGVWGREEGDGR